MSSTNNSESHHETKGVVRATVVDSAHVRSEAANITNLDVTNLNVTNLTDAGALSDTGIRSEWLLARSDVTGPFDVTAGPSDTFIGGAVVFDTILADASGNYGAGADNLLLNANRIAVMSIHTRFRASQISGTGPTSLKVILQATVNHPTLGVSVLQSFMTMTVNDATPDTYNGSVALMDFLPVAPGTAVQVQIRFNDVDGGSDTFRFDSVRTAVHVLSRPL